MRSLKSRCLLGSSAAALGAALVLVPAEPIEASRALEPCDGEPDQGATITQRKSRFETLPEVSLSTRVVDKLNAIATLYQKRTGKSFVVTSGTRAPARQAELIYDKLARGEDLSRLYKDKAAIAELKRVYDEARSDGRDKDNTVILIAGTIRAQMKRGIFVSAHLRAGAADVRSTTMDGADRRAFVEATTQVGGISVMHEASPPHFHLQLD
jgi:hypothetical protein